MKKVFFLNSDKLFYQLSAEKMEINWDFLNNFLLMDEKNKEACKKIVLALRMIGNDEIFSQFIYYDEKRGWNCIRLVQVKIGFRIKGIGYFFNIPLDDYFLKKTLATPMFSVDEWKDFILCRIKKAYSDRIESQNELKEYWQKQVQDRKEMLLERDGEIDESNYFLFLYNLALKSANEMISDLEENEKAFFSACGIE